jgi:hypothetical protein
MKVVHFKVIYHHQSLEIFGVLEVPVSYFASWELFEYWKIFGLFERIKRALPTTTVQPSVYLGKWPPSYTGPSEKYPLRGMRM